MVTEIKKQFRKEMLERRRSLDRALKEESDRCIFERLTELRAYREAKSIFVYVSMPSECNTGRIMEDAWSRGKKVAVPLCVKSDRSMSFFEIRSEKDLRPGAYDIPEPDTRFCERLEEADICLTPGLAFSRNGDRIGYGGGYYDRFFERYPHILKVGIVNDIFLTDIPAAEETDVKMDLIITDKRVIGVTGSELIG